MDTGATFVLWSLIASRRKSADATFDLVELIFLIQLTVDVLSHPWREHLCFMSVSCSKTRNRSTAPASSGSEFVIGVLNNTSCSPISMSEKKSSSELFHRTTFGRKCPP